MKNIFIVGQSGATGVELLNYLENCDFKDKFKLSYSDHNESDLNFRLNQMSNCDIVVLCTPPNISKEIVEGLGNFSGVIIDSSDYYRNDSSWLYAYRPSVNILKNVKRISNPGCFAQGMITLLEPISILLKKNSQLQVNGVTGYSAGGKSFIEKQEKSPLSAKFTNLNRPHTHEEEVNHYFNNKIKVIFVPLVGNFIRGQSVSVVLKATDVVCDITTAYQLIKNSYKEYSDITLLEDSSSVDVKDYPTDFKVAVSVTMPTKDRIMINCFYDNLNIGSAGNVLKILNDIV